MTVVNKALVPSAVAIGSTDMGMLESGSAKRRRTQKPFVVEFGTGVSYLVGTNVEKYASMPPSSRQDFSRFEDNAEIRSLMYATLSQLFEQYLDTFEDENKRAGAETDALEVVVGLPVELMLNKETGKKALSSIRRWMVGNHQYSVDGKEYDVTIANVKARPQPAGSFFAWCLDDYGQWTQPLPILERTIAICDIGFNTLDLWAVDNLEVQKRGTAADTYGMRRASEMLSRMVRENYDISLSLHQADAYIRGLEDPLYLSAGEWLDFNPFIESALATAAQNVIQFIEREWGKAKNFAAVLFTGGGAQALSSQLRSVYEHGVVLEDSVMSNALGLARFASLRQIQQAKSKDIIVAIDPGFGGFKGVLMDNYSDQRAK